MDDSKVDLTPAAENFSDKNALASETEQDKAEDTVSEQSPADNAHSSENENTVNDGNDTSADNDNSTVGGEYDGDTDEDDGDNEDESDDDDGDESDGDDEDEDGEYDEDEEYDRQREEARIRINEERRRKKRKKKSHGRLIFALVMVTLVLSVAVFGTVAVIMAAKEMLGLSRSDSEFSVEIPENSGTEAIANILKNEGIIDSPELFRLISKLKGADGTYIAGVHKVNPNMTYSDLIEALQEEAVNPREFVSITFPEGIRLDEAAAKLEEAGVCKADEFIRTINSASFGFTFEEYVKNSVKKYYKMEGYFFPDTYEFFLDEDPMNVVKKVFKNFDYRVTPDYYGRMNDLGMELEEVMTLASMVQREASNPRDMKMVASVFYNRLNNPEEFPLLQSDPTSDYAENVVAAGLEVYSQSICDAYDTYKGAGLPPGPICSPGLDAIDAVLYPSETNYYFFCSNIETGEFYFAETLEEHEQNLITAGLV